MKPPNINSNDLRDNCPEYVPMTEAPKPLLMSVAFGKPFNTQQPDDIGIFRALAAALVRHG